MRYILDVYTVFAWLEKEKWYLRVVELLGKAHKKELRLAMGVFNFGEVFYSSAKMRGFEEARRVEGRIRILPLEIVAPLEESLVMHAAYLKAQNLISYADAFAAALTEQEKATLLTGDPDCRRVEKIIKLEWLARQSFRT
jgi:predicted nucleic acid-binding protein